MTNKEIIEKLDSIKLIMISAATYGTSSNDEYIKLREELIKEQKLKNKMPLIIKTAHSTNEVKSYMQGLFGGYAERRNFITKEINNLIEYIENINSNENEILKYSKTGWDKIDESTIELVDSLDNISDRISINEIGVRCRETIILLANEVYDDKLHHPKDYPNEISNSDVKRKFDGYFDYYFHGSSNKEKRDFAKSCNNLANFLTHSKNLTSIDAKICINATLSLIKLIKVVYNGTKYLIKEE